MKIIQTLWTGTGEGVPMNYKAGWATPEYHWMSWALSCLLLRRHYDHVELFTDQRGKEILIDELGLPYTKVHVIFDDSFDIHPQLFSLAKIKTFSAQTEPFLHIDGDLFVWKPFPEFFESAGLISSNLEVNLFFNKDILQEADKHFSFSPDYLKNVLHNKDIFASNAGIIGGSNLDFIKEYCNHAFEIIEKNKNSLSLVNAGDLNFLIEQISLYYLAEQQHVDITYYMPQPVHHPLYQDYLRFADIPDVAMIHAVGGCKRNPFVLDHLSQRLRLEFPDLYYHILQKCKDFEIPLRNQIYDHLNIRGKSILRDIVSRNGFINKLKTSIGESFQVPFEIAFQRTLLLIGFECGKSINTVSGLEDFLKTSHVSQQIEEIFLLESTMCKKRDELLTGIKEGWLYGESYHQYQSTANFLQSSDMISKTVCIHTNTAVMTLGWSWIAGSKEERDKKLAKNLETERGEFVVTLVANPMTLGLEETYYDDLDAVVINCLNAKKAVGQLLTEVAQHFEEATVILDSADFRRLIFDTLKRLSFAGVVVLK